MEVSTTLQSLTFPFPSNSRRRRTSLSGKLFNLFATKPKSPPQPPRPFITSPQPLSPRIPKREYSNDENAPLSPSPRPRARPRLQSETSVVIVPRSPSLERKHTPPKGNQARPLKSALKKSASENTPCPFPKSSPYSHTRSPATPFSHTTPTTPPATKTTKRNPSYTWMPFSVARNHASRSASEEDMLRSPPNSPGRKTVKFALDESSSTSTQGALRDTDINTNHASALKRKAEGSPDRNGGPVVFPPGSPTLTRPPVSNPMLSRGRSGYARDVVPPPRTLVGDAVDQQMEDFARETLRSPPLNARAMARRIIGAPKKRVITADMVPHELHSTIWDASDRDTFAWGGTIVVSDTNAGSFIKGVRIEFGAIAEPLSGDSGAADADAAYEWCTSYSGHKVQRKDILKRLDVARGVAVEPKFVLVESSNRDGPHAWLVHFWVPVPLSLFTRSVHRTFVCHTHVVVGGSGIDETLIHSRGVAVGIEALQSSHIAGISSPANSGV